MTFHVLVDDAAWSDVEKIEDGWLAAGDGQLIPLFRDDLRAALMLIGEHPLLRPEIYPDARHEVTKRFRYHIWFRVLPQIEQAEVFAVLHEARGGQPLAERL